MSQNLRPLERRIVALRDEGVAIEDIALRFRRSPAHVARILEWATLPTEGSRSHRKPAALERRVLALRSDGESHERIGERFGRSARFIRQVEGLAHFRRSLDLLSRDP